MPLDSFQDIKRWILRQADEATDGTSDFDSDAEDCIAMAWRDLYPRHPWLCLRAARPGAVTIPAAIKNLTLSVPSTGANVNGTLSASQSSNLTDWIVLIPSKDYQLRIVSHTPPSSTVTLDQVPEALTSVPVVLAKIEASLPTDFGLFVDGLWDGDGGFVPIKSEEDLRSLYSKPSEGWLPQMAARVGKLLIRFSHYPGDRPHRLEFPYVVEPADPSGTAALALDRHLRTALADLALAYLFDLKSDASRSQKRFAVAEIRIDRAMAYESRMLVGLGHFGREAKAGPYHDRRRTGARSIW